MRLCFGVTKNCTPLENMSYYWSGGGGDFKTLKYKLKILNVPHFKSCNNKRSGPNKDIYVSPVQLK